LTSISILVDVGRRHTFLEERLVHLLGACGFASSRKATDNDQYDVLRHDKLLARVERQLGIELVAPPALLSRGVLLMFNRMEHMASHLDGSSLVLLLNPDQFLQDWIVPSAQHVCTQA
jgi:hypothetical protein